MNTTFLESLSAHPLVTSIGWTLVHFILQAAIIGAIIALVLGMMRRSSAQARYLFGLVGLAIMTAAPIVTFAWLVSVSDSKDWNIRTHLAAVESSLLEGEDSVPQTIDEIDFSQGSIFIPGWPLNDLAEGQPSGDEIGEPDSTGAAAAWFARLKGFSGTMQGWLPWCVGIWIAGVLCLAVRLLVGLRRVWLWRSEGIAIVGGELTAALTRLSARMKLRQRVRLLETARDAVPAVIGWIRPAILVPASMLSGLTTAELDSILAHELAHIRRYDYLVNLMQTVVETLLFYHPAIWWLSNRIRTERENCCDDIAIAVCGNRVVFARALARMEETRCHAERLSMAASGGSLVGRIHRIVGTEQVCAGPWWPAGAIVLGSLGLLLGGLWMTANAVETVAKVPVGLAVSYNSNSKLLEADELPRVENELNFQIVDRDDDRITRAAIGAFGDGRTATELVRHFAALDHDISKFRADVSTTNMETIVSAASHNDLAGERIDAAEILFNLPEGSDLRAEFSGQNIRIEKQANSTSVWVIMGRVELIDAGGIIRASASPAGGAEMLVVECREEAGEVVMKLTTGRRVGFENPENQPVQVSMNTDTGAPMDEKDSPHRGIRYEIQQGDHGSKSFMQMKMKWRYDVKRLAEEAYAESGLSVEELIFGKSNDKNPESTQLMNPTKQGLTIPAPEIPDDNAVEQAKALGDWTRSFARLIEFDSAGYARLAARLMELETDSRVLALQELGNQQMEGQLVVLCRMLFEAKAEGEFRRPGLGGPVFIARDTTMEDFPLEPIALIETVPFLIVQGYDLAGHAEPASAYLDYCLKNCQWTRRSFDISPEQFERAKSAFSKAAFWGDQLPDASDDDGWGELAADSGLRSRLTLQTEHPAVGQPLRFKLEVKNFGKKPTTIDPQRFEPYRVLRSKLANGQSAQFIGMTPQTYAERIELKPGESYTCWENVDAANLFLLNEGQYEFLVEGGKGVEQAFWRDSNKLKVDIAAGDQTPLQQLIGELAKNLPDKWKVANGMGLGEGWKGVFLTHRPTGLKRDATGIQIWFTDDKLADDFELGQGDQIQIVTQLGKCELGFTNVAAQRPTLDIWPQYLEHIRRAANAALNFEAVNKAEIPPGEPADIDEKLPWVAKGTVTTADGKPFAGVTVNAFAGMGSLMRTGSAVTDENGRYELRFGPGIWSDNPELVQVATICVKREGHFEKNLGRQGDLLAAYQIADQEKFDFAGRNANDVFLPNEPKVIDFVMVPATRIRGTVIDADGKRMEDVRVSLVGEEMPPSSSVVANTRTNGRGKFELNDVPGGFEFQLLIQPTKAESPWLAWASPPMVFVPRDDGNTHLEYSVDGEHVDFSFQQVFVTILDDGVNWKTALKEAAQKELKLTWDGLSTDRMVSAGMAFLELGDKQK